MSQKQVDVLRIQEDTPTRYAVQVPKHGKVVDLRRDIVAICGVDFKTIFLAVVTSGYLKSLDSMTDLSDIPSSVIMAYEFKETSVSNIYVKVPIAVFYSMTMHRYCIQKRVKILHILGYLLFYPCQ